MPAFHYSKKPTTGFTLAEMAIVVLLIGIMMTMGLKMVTANLDNTAYSDTKAKQERIKTALIGFLRTNGRLPCPDSTAGVATGSEVTPCATAVSAYGVVPWQTLGLAREAAQDGWGNLFTYRVSNLNPATAAAAGVPPVHRFSNQNWAINAGAGAFDIRSFADAPLATAGFQSLRVNTVGGAAESRTAVVVILSHGKNGYGAKTIKVAARMPAPPAANINEGTNATIGQTIFVRRPVSDIAAAPGPYDDVVAYMNPQDLLQPLITERSLLGACSAYCTAGGPAPCPTTTTVPIGSPGPLACP